MIKLFRSIRKSLLTENKASKYLLYALGEIFLVVIGILLALQINNWNQNRLNLLEKNELLSELNVEFKANKKALSDYRLAEQNAIEAGIELINLVGASKEKLSDYNLDSLLFESFPANELAFADNAVNNIVQSGRLNLFKDDTIATLLYQWNSLGEIRKIRIEKLDLWNNEEFIPFLLPYISFREMDSYANFRWTGKSKVKPDYYPLFQKVEFENCLENTLWMHQKIIDRLNESEVLIDKIINVTRPQES